MKNSTTDLRWRNFFLAIFALVLAVWAFNALVLAPIRPAQREKASANPPLTLHAKPTQTNVVFLSPKPGDKFHVGDTIILDWTPTNIPVSDLWLFFPPPNNFLTEGRRAKGRIKLNGKNGGSDSNDLIFPPISFVMPMQFSYLDWGTGESGYREVKVPTEVHISLIGPFGTPKLNMIGPIHLLSKKE